MFLRPPIQRQTRSAPVLPFQHVVRVHGLGELGPRTCRVRHVCRSRRTVARCRKIQSAAMIHSSGPLSGPLVTHTRFVAAVHSSASQPVEHTATSDAFAAISSGLIGAEQGQMAAVGLADNNGNLPGDLPALDPESGEDVPVNAEELTDALSRPPPVNSDYLPLPWEGRLGYVSNLSAAF